MSTADLIIDAAGIGIFTVLAVDYWSGGQHPRNRYPAFIYGALAVAFTIRVLAAGWTWMGWDPWWAIPIGTVYRGLIDLAGLAVLILAKVVVVKWPWKQ